jgi:hypothetical protein
MRRDWYQQNHLCAYRSNKLGQVEYDICSRKDRD